MAIDPLTLYAMGSTAIGGLGSLFEAFSEDEVEKLLKGRLRGIDPKTLEEMRRRVRGAIGNQATAERVSTGQRLGREDAPIAKQQEILDKIRVRQFGAIGESLSDIDFMNEQFKSGALSEYANYMERQNQGKGMGYASLLGSGVNYLLNAPKDQSRFYAELDRMGGVDSRRLRDFRFPRGNVSGEFRSSYGSR